MEISKEEVMRYERVRQSGATNMFDVRTVEALSELSRDKIMAIMKDYSNLIEKYSISRGE